jgi:hypothetical protein
MSDPVDMTQVQRDDELLDALVRGEAAPADDELAVLLAAWRDDLSLDLSDEDDGPYSLRPAAPLPASPAPARTVRRPARRAGRGRTLSIAAAAVLIGLAGGTTAAAANAGPDSPLWPITRVVFADHADSVLSEQSAEDSIAKAREAIAQSRYADADKLLDEAATSAGKVHDEGTVRRLLDEISAVRGLLPGIGSPGAAPTAGVPGQGGGSQPPGGAGTGGGSTANPAASGGVLPPLPVPLPTITVCLPLPLLCPTP